MNDAENPKVRQILSTARNLFMKHGIRRVSIEEVCREAKVSKMTFYKYFRNKGELTRCLLENIVSESMARYREIMDRDIPFSEKVEQTIHLKMEQTEDISREFLDDLYKHGDRELLEFFDRQRQESIQTVVRDYMEAQKRGDVRQDIEPAFILYFLNHVVDMAKDEKLTALFESPRDMIMELTNFFFYGILPRHDPK